MEHDFLKKKFALNLEINGVRFSEREYQVLFYLIRGNTAKRIGFILGLSQRTIETYLQNIKMKLCVYSKSELIEKIIDYFI